MTCMAGEMQVQESSVCVCVCVCVRVCVCACVYALHEAIWQGKCKCKSHPCVVAGRAACDDPKLPMLDYRSVL